MQMYLFSDEQQQNLTHGDHGENKGVKDQQRSISSKAEDCHKNLYKLQLL